MAKIISTTSSFIPICLIAFTSILAIFLYPRTFPLVEDASSCQLGTKPDNYNETLLLPKPAIMNDETGEGTWGSAPLSDPNAKTEFVLIRKDLPIPDKSELEGASYMFLGGPTLAEQHHTASLGEISEKLGFNLHYPTWGGAQIPKIGDINFIREGLVFFINNDPKTVFKIRNINLYSADVYQEKEIFEKNTRLNKYQPEDLFVCGKSTVQTPPRVMIPSQIPSETNEQLQLEWFAFQKSIIWALHCKPAIYLYPPEKMVVNVKVYPAGSLTYTDPQYDSKTGWTVDAYPDGSLLPITYNSSSLSEEANSLRAEGLKPTTYSYLYFESKVRDEVIKKPTKGWVIESESSVVSQVSQEWFTPLENQFKVLLPQLGLNTEQAKDFIDYWKKALPYSPYYFVGVIDQANVDQIERLEITPKPDSINRVRIYFERLDQPKEVTAPLLPTTTYQLQPTKFNVVEWGGMVKNDLNHPFTCSQ